MKCKKRLQYYYGGAFLLRKTCVNALFGMYGIPGGGANHEKVGFKNVQEKHLWRVYRFPFSVLIPHGGKKGGASVGIHPGLLKEFL